MSYTRKLVHGAGIVLLLSALAGLVTYILRIVLARNLGPADYGLFYSVFTFIIFFLFFRDLGLGAALVKYVAEWKVQEQYDKIKTAIVSVFVVQLLSSVVFAIIMFFLAGPLAEHYFKDPRSALIIQILLLYLLFSIFFITLKQVFLGLQETFIYGSFELVKNSLTLVLVFLLLKGGWNVFAPVIAYTAVCLILVVIYLPIFLRKFPFFQYKILHYKSISQQLLQFGLPVLATTVGGKVIGYIDTLFLTYFRSLTEVGVYNVILPSALIFLDLGTTLGIILLPMTSELWAKGDYRRLEAGVRLLHRYLLALVIPLLIIPLVYADLFIGLLFGPEYLSGSLAFQILVVGVLLCIVGSVNGSILSGIGQPKKVTKIVLLAAAVNVIVNMLLIPRYGINGAAIATSLSYGILLVLSTFTLTRHFHIPFPVKEWGKLLLAGTGFLLVILVIKTMLNFNPWLIMLISIVPAVVVYLLLLYLLNIVSLPEIKRYLRLVLS